MLSLSKCVLEYATVQPEAAPLCSGVLLHLGSQAVADQALSRLAPSACDPSIHASACDRPSSSRSASRSQSCGTRPSFPTTPPPPTSSASPHEVPCCSSISRQIPTTDCALVHKKCACTICRVGNSWRCTARLETTFAPWHGPARERLRTLLRRSPTSFSTTTRPNCRRRGRSCQLGWWNW